MPCSYQIISEILPEIHTMEKVDFLKPISHSQIMLYSAICYIRYISLIWSLKIKYVASLHFNRVTKSILYENIITKINRQKDGN